MIVGVLAAVAIVSVLAGVTLAVDWVLRMRRRIAELEAAR